MYDVRMFRAQDVHVLPVVPLGERNRNRMLYWLKVVTLGTIEIVCCEESRLEAGDAAPVAEVQRLDAISEKELEPDDELESSVPVELLPVVAMSITQYEPVSLLEHIASESGMIEYSTSYVRRTASFLLVVSSLVQAA